MYYQHCQLLSYNTNKQQQPETIFVQLNMKTLQYWQY